MLKSKSLLALGMTSALVVACGGDSGSGSSSKSLIQIPEIKAQFIDAPVKGLNVSTSKGESKTGDNGYFNCKAGETVHFTLRGLVLGNASCGERIFIDEVAGSNADNAAAILQSLSKTAANTGLIDLSDLPDSVDLSTMVLEAADITIEIDTAKTGVLTGIPTVATVTADDARSHVDTQLAEFSTLSAEVKAALLSSANSSSTVYVGARLVQGSIDDCYKFVTAPLKMSIKAGMPAFTISEYIESDEKFYTTCASKNVKSKTLNKSNKGEMDEDCYISEIDFSGSSSNRFSLFKMITSNKVNAGYNIVSNLTADGEGGFEAVTKFPNGNTLTEPFNFEDEDGEILPIMNVPESLLKNHGEFISMSLDFSKFPQISGTASMNYTNLELYDWKSETNYDLRRSVDSCGYKFEVLNQ